LVRKNGTRECRWIHVLGIVLQSFPFSTWEWSQSRFFNVWTVFVYLFVLLTSLLLVSSLCSQQLLSFRIRKRNKCICGKSNHRVHSFSWTGCWNLWIIDLGFPHIRSRSKSVIFGETPQKLQLSVFSLPFFVLLVYSESKSRSIQFNKGMKSKSICQCWHCFRLIIHTSYSPFFCLSPCSALAQQLLSFIILSPRSAFSNYCHSSFEKGTWKCICR
jgi:hypothetical protein